MQRGLLNWKEKLKERYVTYTVADLGERPGGPARGLLFWVKWREGKPAGQAKNPEPHLRFKSGPPIAMYRFMLGNQ